MHHAYEPSRIRQLSQRSCSAVSAIDAINSDDPAASEALAAITQLKSVIAEVFIPATAAVGLIDPLGVSTASTALVTPDWGPGAWWDRHTSAPTRFHEWSDDELFDVMSDQLDWFTRLDIDEDSEHFFWTEDLPALATEFRRRAAIDPEFAERMIEEAGSNPMIGLIVAEGGFSDEVLAGVTVATATDGVTAFESGRVRSFVLDRLLEELDGRTAVAVAVLGDAEAFEWLFTWNEHDHTSRPLDRNRLESILADVLDEPFVRPDALDDVHIVIANVVDLADHQFFDTGFPPSLALTIGEGILPFLPYIVGSLDDIEGVSIRDFDGDRAVRIGTPAEVADLFGNLLRDPTTRVYVIDSIVVLTLSSGSASHLYTVEDLGTYIETLLDATEIELNEEAIQAARERDRWDLTIDIVFGLVDKGLEAGGKKLEGARTQVKWAKAGARWLVDQIDADDIGLEAVHLSIRIMFSIGLAMLFLAHFEPDDEDADELAANAESSLADVNEIFAEAAENGTPIDLTELNDRVRDLEDDIELIDDRVFAPAADAGLDPDPLIPARDGDLTN